MLRLQMAAHHDAFSIAVGEAPASRGAAWSRALFQADEAGVEVERWRPGDLGGLDDVGEEAATGPDSRRAVAEGSSRTGTGDTSRREDWGRTSMLPRLSPLSSSSDKDNSAGRKGGGGLC
nr:predicted protein [Triticum aestivum]